MVDQILKFREEAFTGVDRQVGIFLVALENFDSIKLKNPEKLKKALKNANLKCRFNKLHSYKAVASFDLNERGSAMFQKINILGIAQIRRQMMDTYADTFAVFCSSGV